MTEFCVWYSTKEKLPTADKNVLIKYIDQDAPDVERVSIGYKESNDPNSQYWFDLMREDEDGCVEAIFTVVYWAEIPNGPKIL